MRNIKVNAYGEPVRVFAFASYNELDARNNNLQRSEVFSLWEKLTEYVIKHYSQEHLNKKTGSFGNLARICQKEDVPGKLSLFSLNLEIITRRGPELKSNPIFMKMLALYLPLVGKINIPEITDLGLKIVDNIKYNRWNQKGK